MQLQAEKTAEPSSHWSDEVGKRAPNILTFLRLLAVPIFVWLLIRPTPQTSLWATAIFIIASLTDWLDGYIARIYKAESVIGTLLDPVADKILVMAALVMLAASQPEPRIPAWIVVCLLAREFLVSGLRSLAAVRGTVVAASRFAKHKTAWTMLAVVFLLVDGSYHIFGALVDFHFYGMVFLWIALFFSVFTGLDYAVKLRKMFL
ncbi:MAG: CDP-diacylglycerol--glycerol-3-phosphate 3-phosphatidyltransferase [Bdellovibrionota bacterium]